jgi:tRNA threonylcarbamoyladenosine biosynthesis protein TsaB
MMADKSLMLAIDTATRFAGIAVYDGDTIRCEAYWLSRNNHSVELMPALARMLEQQGTSAEDLSAIAVAIGPGSFTGLRIGLGVAKGLAHAQNIPILGVPTLDILAFQHAEQRRPIWAIIQAGRKRLCAARYERRRGRWRQRGGVRLTTLEGLLELFVGRCLICGELDRQDIDYISEHTEADVIFATPSQATRRPACLAELAWQRFERGEQDDLATLSPIYIHNTQT